MESKFDSLFDGDANIEEGELEINDNANNQEITVQEHGDLQAACLMIQTITLCIQGK